MVGHPQQECIDDELEQAKCDDNKWQREKGKNPAKEKTEKTVNDGYDHCRSKAFNFDLGQNLSNNKDNNTEQKDVN